MGSKRGRQAMGSEYWSYFVPYQEDIGAALQELRQREFAAGRFWQPPLIYPGLLGRLLGKQPHKPKTPESIEEAIRIAGETGTRSILDMERMEAEPDYGAVARLRPKQIMRLFGTDKPTREMAENSEELVESIGRGQGVYIVTWRDGKPDAIWFAGYSYD